MPAAAAARSSRTLASPAATEPCGAGGARRASWAAVVRLERAAASSWAWSSRRAAPGPVTTGALDDGVEDVEPCAAGRFADEPVGFVVVVAAEDDGGAEEGEGEGEVEEEEEEVEEVVVVVVDVPVAFPPEVEAVPDPPRGAVVDVVLAGAPDDAPEAWRVGARLGEEPGRPLVLGAGTGIPAAVANAVSRAVAVAFDWSTNAEAIVP